MQIRLTKKNEKAIQQIIKTSWLSPTKEANRLIDEALRHRQPKKIKRTGEEE